MYPHRHKTYLTLYTKTSWKWNSSQLELARKYQTCVWKIKLLLYSCILNHFQETHPKTSPAVFPSWHPSAESPLWAVLVAHFCGATVPPPTSRSRRPIRATAASSNTNFWEHREEDGTVKTQTSPSLSAHHKDAPWHGTRPAVKFSEHRISIFVANLVQSCWCRGWGKKCLQKKRIWQRNLVKHDVERKKRLKV